MRKGRSTAAIAVSLAAMFVAAPAALAGPGSTEHGVSRVKLAQRAEQITEQRNSIEVLKISRCSPSKRRGRVNFSKWTCYWRAEGIYPGNIPYHCSGKASWKRKKDRWRVDACANRLQPQAPLLTTPNPEPVFGFNDDWIFLGDQALDMSLTAGAEVARTSIPWAGVEPTSGQMNWHGSDVLYQRLLSRGMRPLWVLVGAPCWAQPNPGRCANGQDEVRPAVDRYGELGDFAVKVAHRYPESIGIEVWNEPNYPRFWGGPPEPARYAQMLKTVAEALHRDAPGMTVVSAGLSPHSDHDESGAAGYSEFLAEIYERGAAQQADAIGIHPYPGVGPADDYIADVRIQLGRIQAILAKNGDSDTPLWATEFGVSTTGPHAFDPGHQGRALVELHELMRYVHRVDVAIVHNFVENSKFGERETGFGVVNPNLTPKSSYCDLVRLRGASAVC